MTATYKHTKCNNEMVDIKEAFQRRVYAAWWCSTCQMGIISPLSSKKKFGFTVETYKKVHTILRKTQKLGIKRCEMSYLKAEARKKGIDYNTLLNYLTLFVLEEPQAVKYERVKTAKSWKNEFLISDMPLTSSFMDYTKEEGEVFQVGSSIV